MLYARRRLGSCVHWRNFQAASTFLELLVIARFSPPSTDALVLSLGSGATFHLSFGASLVSGPICHGPLTISAARWFSNCWSTAAWSQLTMLLDIWPLLTRSAHSASAARPPSESSESRSAPAAHRNGSHWNVPSSDLTALTASPFCLPEVSLAQAARNESQSVGMSTPACLSAPVLAHSVRQLELSGSP